MNKEYVEKLSRPNNDSKAVKEEATKLIEGKVFSKELIMYSIENFLESSQAYYDDCDPNKLYYKVMLKDKTRNFCFDIENLPHLLGLPNNKILFEASILNELVKQKTNSKNWLEVFKKTIETHKEEIINYDSDSNNIDSKKLNWDKVAEKVFAFLNLGILSEGKTLYYRHNISPSKNDIKKYIMVRELISKQIEGQLKILFISTEMNGEEVFVPVSIRFEEEIQKKGLIKLNGDEYKFEGEILIEQKEGSNYGKR